MISLGKTTTGQSVPSVQMIVGQFDYEEYQERNEAREIAAAMVNPSVEDMADIVRKRNT